jgi:hypothetical protein
MNGRIMMGDKVYVAKCAETGYCKIGVSCMPLVRVREIATAIRSDVALIFCFPGSFQEERFLKRQLAACRVEYPFKKGARMKACGRSEWFDLRSAESGLFVEMLHSAALCGEVTSQ